MSLTAHEVIVRPVISEKSMDQTNRHKYTFAVADDANKLQIKDAVEALFKVTVLDVNVLTTKRKEKSRNRRRSSQRLKAPSEVFKPWPASQATVWSRV